MIFLCVLITLNFIWVSLCLYAFFVRSPIQFYIAAGFVGLSMGGIQSLARSTYSKFIPKTDDTTSFFSFYSTSQMTGIVIGMLLFGTIDQITGSMRNSVLFFLSFFLIGAFLLIRIHRRMTNWVLMFFISKPICDINFFGFTFIGHIISSIVRCI